MTTFRTAYDGYILSQKARNVSKSYIDLLVLTRDYWLRLNPDGELAGIKTDVVREWITWLQGERKVEGVEAPFDGQLSGASVFVHFRDLRSFFNWCVDEELLAASPMRRMKKPKFEEKLPDVLTEAEVRDLLKAVRESGNPQAFRDYTIHLMFTDCGIRLEELSSLDLEDINLEQGYAKVLGKGRKERVVPMGIRLRRELHRYILRYRRAATGETALFCNDDGFRLERGGVRTMVVRDQKAYVARTLSKYGPHLERHTSATIRLRNTGDIQRTSQILGHRSLETTQRYLHLVHQDLMGDSSPMDAVLSEKRGKSLQPNVAQSTGG